MRSKIVKAKKVEIYGYSLLFISILLTFIRCRYGWGDTDEGFYLSVPYRYYNGDAPFVDEWNLSQLTGLFLIPLIKFHYYLFDSNEGIILFARYFYCCAQLVTSILIIKLLKRKYGVGVIFFSSFFVLFTPMNIMALSYNTIAIISLTLSTALFLTREIKWHMFIAGFLYGIAVICNPYIFLIFIVYTIATIIKYIRYKSSLMQYCLFALGGVMVLLATMLWISSSADINECIRGIKMSLSLDAGHGNKNFVKAGILYLFEIFRINAIGHVLLFIVLLLRKKIGSRIKNVIICFILLSDYILALDRINLTVNTFTITITIAGAVLWLKGDEEHDDKDILVIWLVGILYSYSMFWASNTGLLAIGQGLILSTLATFLYAGKVVNPSIKKNCIVFLFTGIWLVMSVFRMYGTYYDEYLDNQVNYIDKGPEKGLYVNNRRYKDYAIMYNDALSLADEKVLYLTRNSWVYLLDGYDNISYSAWITDYGVDYKSALKKFDAYYDIHSEKKPEYIYVYMDYSNEKFAEEFIARGYEVVEEEADGPILLQCQ